MNLNKVFIIGRITADINLKMTAGGQPIANFSVATNRVWTDKSGSKQEDTEFHNIVVWGKQAELASQFLAKGSLVMIEGRLKTRTWQDQNNNTRKVTEIICERMQFGPRSASSGGPRPQSASQPKSKEPASDLENQFSDTLEEGIPQINIDEEQIKPEDLPF